MSDSAKLHEVKYQEARAAGLPGWGGSKRISQLPQMVEERFFSFDGVPRHGKLLELGCGAGNLSLVLADKGFDVSGVDFSQSAIDWAKENARKCGKKIKFKVMDVTLLSSFENESFDVLFDGNCLHCIIGEKRFIALAEWKRILKPNGFLFISSLCAPLDDSAFPNTFNALTRVLTESGLPYRFIPTPKYIISELQSAGFEILHEFVRMESPFGHINIHARLTKNKL